MNLSLPSQEDLLLLEKEAINKGSGLTGKDLVGIWNFSLVWSKGNRNAETIKSNFLRFFSASLEILHSETNKSSSDFTIKNSVSLLSLRLEFQGSALLAGPQPLLSFYFNKVVVNLGQIPVFSSNLSKPKKNEMPFFKLIATGRSHQWLAARGRGGGLALWLRE